MGSSKAIASKYSTGVVPLYLTERDTSPWTASLTFANSPTIGVSSLCTEAGGECHCGGDDGPVCDDDEGNWIQLHLVGSEGPAAIGARATVSADSVTQTQEVGGGFGHYSSQNDMVLNFGLGAACEANVTVLWPDSDLTEETITLTAGYRFLVTQGEFPRLEP